MEWRFPLFEAVDLAGKLDIEKPVDWNLIEQIDPQLIRHEPISRKLGKFLKHFPYYRLESADSRILSHPLSVRFFLIVQAAFCSLVRSISRYRSQIEQQIDTISHLSEELSAERSLRKSCRDMHRQTEKFYACGKRDLTMRRLDDHFERHHKPLVTSWKKITSDDYLDENIERIAELKAQIHELKSRLCQPPPPSPRAAAPRSAPRPKVTYFAVQPRAGPCCPVSERETFPHPPKLEGIATAKVYDAIVEGEDTIQQEARDRLQRRQFSTVRTCLKVRLEHALPLPGSLQSQSSRATDSETPPRRESPAGVGPSVDQFRRATDSESASVRPFIIASDSDEGKESANRHPLLVSDHEYSSIGLT
jgi:hypothetical protein